MNNWKDKLILVLIICFIKGCLFSQTTFNNTYDFSTGIEGAYSVTTVNDGFILVGNGWGSEIGAFFDFKIKYEKIDFDGNLLWQKFIGDNAINFFIYPKSTLLSLDGNVIFCGSKQTGTTSEIHLIKINSSTGDTIFYSNFNYDDEIYGIQLQELSDGSLIILGYDSNDAFAYLLLKTTAEGQFTWDKRYGALVEGYPTDFNIVSDTLYIINGNFLCSPLGYHLRKIDSEGNIISTDSFTDDCLSNGLKSITGGFIGGGAYYPAPPYQTFIYKTDVVGNVLWHYDSNIDIDTLYYEQLFPDIVKELPNGDMIVAGYFSSNYLGSYIGFISKIDIDGNPYWERIYTSTDDNSDDNIIYDIDFSNDGGIILAGSTFGAEASEGQNFWALKLDSLGCLIPGCDTIGDAILELVTDETGILVYPNPIHTQAIIQLTLNSTFDLGNLKVRISDIRGKLLDEYELDKSHLVIDGNKIRFAFNRNLMNNGVYFLAIYSDATLIGTQKVILQ